MPKFERLTIDDIARLAQVSKTTASMVLNGRAEQYRIAQATQDRVLAIAQQHHFSPSQSARTLRSRRSNSIGLVIPELSNFAHASLAQELETQARHAAYQLVIVTSADDAEREEAALRHLLSRQVDGILIVPCTNDAQRYASYAKRVPLIQVDRRVTDSALPFVVTAAQSMVSDLIFELASAPGVNEVVYFGGQADLSPSQDRLAGFRAGLARAGLKEQAAWVWQRDFQRCSGLAMMTDYYQQLGRYPQVLFAASITLLEGVLTYIKQQHQFRQAPGKLAAFDHHDLLDYLPLPVDTIVQDSAGLARAALEKVLALGQGHNVESAWITAKCLRRV